MGTNKTQHTPAPWSTIDSFSRPTDVNSEMMHFRTRIECIAPFRENENSDRPNELVQYQTLCHVYGRTVEEMKANAEFIANAPELLKENEQLLTVLKEIYEDDKINGILKGETRVKMKSAIAKAEGK